ncbi:MAG: nucleotide exchange factor GrpE [Dehalococcoidia bacterium]|nr:MAG: nucleotide exchange factor GrpE [Dehalococcoidia bacterium]
MPLESDENVNSEVVPEVTEAEDIESLKQALAEEKGKAEGYLANWQRTQADFINYKRRNEQEREEFNKFASTGLVLSLLPILDDLERALASIPVKSAKLTWVDGIRLIERKFRVSLETQGLTLIKALGEPFNPNLHEAVRQDKGKEGIVISELQKGYKFHDRVIRPTMVVVGNGEEAAKEER